ELVEEARVRHGTLPTATAALGRALTAGLLLGGLSKADERVSLQWSGDAPLGSILVDATPGGQVRGFVSRPQTHLPARAGKLDVGGAVGRGVLCVMRIPLGEASPYRSIVPLVSGEIGTDVASYLAGSEQIPSVVGVGVFVHADGRVGAAGGYLLQAMPGADAEAVDRLEEGGGAARAGPGFVEREPAGPTSASAPRVECRVVSASQHTMGDRAHIPSICPPPEGIRNTTTAGHSLYLHRDGVRRGRSEFHGQSVRERDRFERQSREWLRYRQCHHPRRDANGSSHQDRTRSGVCGREIRREGREHRRGGPLTLSALNDDQFGDITKDKNSTPVAKVDL